jgi:hypothetical protein
MSKEINKVIFLERDQNVLAYCPNCQSTVYLGNDEVNQNRMVLRQRIIEHLEFWGEDHNIDVIYPRRDHKRITEGVEFIIPYVIQGVPKKVYFS